MGDLREPSIQNLLEVCAEGAYCTGCISEVAELLAFGLSVCVIGARESMLVYGTAVCDGLLFVFNSSFLAEVSCALFFDRFSLFCCLFLLSRMYLPLLLFWFVLLFLLWFLDSRMVSRVVLEFRVIRYLLFLYKCIYRILQFGYQTSNTVVLLLDYSVIYRAVRTEQILVP